MKNNELEKRIEKAIRNFGSVEFDGKAYFLESEADFTGTQLLQWQAEEGYRMFSAKAIDEEGNECRVYWVLKAAGVEDLSGLDWEDVKRVELI